MSCRHCDRVLEEAARVEFDGHLRGIPAVRWQQGPLPEWTGECTNKSHLPLWRSRLAHVSYPSASCEAIIVQMHQLRHNCLGILPADKWRSYSICRACVSLHVIATFVYWIYQKNFARLIKKLTNSCGMVAVHRALRYRSCSHPSGSPKLAVTQYYNHLTECKLTYWAAWTSSCAHSW